MQEARAVKRYVIYTRVSTKEQGRSGLGLEAQERDITLFLNKFSEEPWEVIGRYQDIQSGANDARPELTAALAHAKREGAELLVAKLDRLSRDVEFVAGAMKRATIRVATMPNADPFQMHLFAALAEQERKFIKARTKAALQAARNRGVKLGGLRDKTMRRNAAIKAKAKREAEKLIKIIGPMREANKTLTQIADALSEMNVATSRGGRWTPTQVKRVLERAT